MYMYIYIYIHIGTQLYTYILSTDISSTKMAAVQTRLLARERTRWQPKISGAQACTCVYNIYIYIHL